MYVVISIVVLLDDITHPDEEKGNCLSINSNDELVSKSEEDDAKEHLQPSQHARGLMLPVLKAEIGGKTNPAVFCRFDANRFLVLVVFLCLSHYQDH